MHINPADVFIIGLETLSMSVFLCSLYGVKLTLVAQMFSLIDVLIDIHCGICGM